MIDVLWLDGTWSPNGGTPASEAVRRALDPRVFRFRYVPYPAAYGPVTGNGPSYAESKLIGARALALATQESPYPVIVGGYSQGAAGAVAFVREILRSRPDLVVLALATIGDPHNVWHDYRSGIAGALSVQIPRFTVYAPGDPIADLSVGSPLRSIADLSDWMAIRDLDDMQVWALDVFNDIVKGRVQRWNPLDFTEWWQAVAAAGRYLNGTAHTLDYVRGGHSARLAGMLNARFG